SATVFGCGGTADSGDGDTEDTATESADWSCSSCYGFTDLKADVYFFPGLAIAHCYARKASHWIKLDAAVETRRRDGTVFYAWSYPFKEGWGYLNEYVTTSSSSVRSYRAVCTATWWNKDKHEWVDGTVYHSVWRSP